MHMLKNYFLVALRNLKKHKVFSLINICGLSVGLAVFWLMALYIGDELSYDRQSVNADRLYRVVHQAAWSNGSFHLAPTSAPFGPALKKDYSEIEDIARIDAEGGGTIVYEDKKISAEDILVADNSLLTMFQYPMLYGDAQTALAKPGAIVLTKTLAEKLFGDASYALHKTIQYQNSTEPMEVTGVLEDIPLNSHLHFSGVRSMPPNFDEPWPAFHLYTYILLNKNADVRKLEAKLPGFYNNHLKSFMGAGTKYQMELQPVTSIHLHSNLDYEIGRNSDIRYIYLFAGVALLVLLIAVINYINLATARSSIRVREIGVRKVIGSGRSQLISLFLAESVFFTLAAAALAVSLAAFMMPVFNRLADKNLSLWEFGLAPTVAVLLVFSVLTGLAGGFYPALFLSGFKTIPALKGLQGNLRGNALFRKSLVTFQFVITIALVAASGILYQQMRFMLNKDLGFNKDQVLSFHIYNHSLREHTTELKAKLMQNPLIEGAAVAGNPIGHNDIGSGSFNFEENGQISGEARMAQSFVVDPAFLGTMQIKLAAGRNFSDDMATDRSQAVLVNETLTRQLGWKEPIGKRVQFHTDDQGHVAEARVIGVVKDFNIYSLQHKIEPLLLQMPAQKRDEDNLYVRVSKKNVAAALAYIESTYRSFDSSSPFEFHFLDENFAQQYASERKLGNLLLVFTILAVLIACLGLFGLVTFAVEQRKKEIGIRKVLGSSIGGIVSLVSKDLLRPVVLAILIATPLAWFGMTRWLNGFAYHVAISVWLFVAAGFVAVFIALLTVSLRALRAALANPVNSLRSE